MSSSVGNPASFVGPRVFPGARFFSPRTDHLGCAVPQLAGSSITESTFFQQTFYLGSPTLARTRSTVPTYTFYTGWDTIHSAYRYTFHTGQDTIHSAYRYNLHWLGHDPQCLHIYVSHWLGHDPQCLQIQFTLARTRSTVLCFQILLHWLGHDPQCLFFYFFYFFFCCFSPPQGVSAYLR